MDFVRLGPLYSTTYLPDKLIEGYNSLVWAERTPEPGDFELKSYDVSNLSALLPPDTLVSHLETEEVMIVETHSIDMVGDGDEAQPEITIKGRSLTSFLDNRHVEAVYQKKRPLRRSYSAVLAAAVLITNAIDNASGKDLTRGYLVPTEVAWQKFSWDPYPYEAETNDFPWPTNEAIANVVVTETVANEGTGVGWHVEQGPLYPQLEKILTTQDLGLRCLRPVPNNKCTVLTVTSALANRGLVSRAVVNYTTALRWDIFQGTDRRTTVRFSLLQGDLDKPKYLDSIAGYKNSVEIMGSMEQADVLAAGTGSYSGLQKRVTSMDGGSPEIPDAPTPPPPLKKNATQKQKTDRADEQEKYLLALGRWQTRRANAISALKAANVTEAGRVLKAARKVSMFSGDISETARYKYGVDFNLGDMVTLVGDYNRTAYMVVNEYVRTDDENGDRGFPGLVTP